MFTDEEKKKMMIMMKLKILLILFIFSFKLTHSLTLSGFWNESGFYMKFNSASAGSVRSSGRLLQRSTRTTTIKYLVK